MTILSSVQDICSWLTCGTFVSSNACSCLIILMKLRHWHCENKWILEVYSKSVGKCLHAGTHTATHTCMDGQPKNSVVLPNCSCHCWLQISMICNSLIFFAAQMLMLHYQVWLLKYLRSWGTAADQLNGYSPPPWYRYCKKKLSFYWLFSVHYAVWDTR